MEIQPSKSLPLLLPLQLNCGFVIGVLGWEDFTVQ